MIGTSIHWRSAARKLFRQHGGPVLVINCDDHSSITIKAISSSDISKISRTAVKEINKATYYVPRKRKDLRMV